MNKERGILVKQRGITDCGVACLSSISYYYNIHVSYEVLRQSSQTNKHGTNLSGLIKAASRIGLTAKGVRANKDALFVVNFPTIAHILKDGALLHYVVLYSIDDAGVEYMDPSDAEMHKVPWTEFLQEWTGILLLIEKDTKHKSNPIFQTTATQHWTLLSTLLSPYIGKLWKILLLSALCSLLGICATVYLGILIDEVLSDKAYTLLNALSILMLLLSSLKVGMGFLKEHFTLQLARRLDDNLVKNYYLHVLHLSLEDFERLPIGDYIERLNDAFRIRSFISEVLVHLIMNTFVFLTAIIVFLFLAWKLALIVIGILPIIMVICNVYSKKSKSLQQQVMSEGAKNETFLIECLQGLETIKLHSATNYTSKKILSGFCNFLDAHYKNRKATIQAHSRIEIVAAIVMVCILWVGCHHVIDETISMGTLIICSTLSTFVLDPISSFVFDINAIQETIVASQRLQYIKNLTEEHDTSSKDTTPKHFDVVFDNVYFSYDCHTPLIQAFSSHFREGHITLIIGNTGSGKSTLLSLLSKKYSPCSGQILIGGIPLKEMSLSCLRQIIAFVPQHIHLFAGTIESNIAFGMEVPDEKRLKEVAEKVGLSNFVHRQPLGWQTPLGEKGLQLSGGEMQRLALARALYKDPKILILDETMSGQDSPTVMQLQRLFRNLADEGKVVIIITHQLELMDCADDIVYMKEEE